MLFGSAFALALSSLPLLATAAPVPDEPRIEYDAVIVGGGPAGLAALSGLARVRRHALLIDSGEYRNGPTRHMHDVLGYDGVTPAYYRDAARKQLSSYSTVSMTNGTVTKIEPQANNTYFKVSGQYFDDKERKQIAVTARKVVLATGLRDLLPPTAGIRENWGKGIYWCPWCDGHEHADQGLGLLAPLESVPGLVREILTLNRDIVAFVNGTDTPATRATTEDKSPRWQDYLKLHGVRVENRTIAAVVRLANGTTGHEDPSRPTAPEHDLFEVQFVGGGEPVRRNAFLASFKEEQATTLGADTGVALYGGRLAADSTKGLVTNIPGVYAIGDANSDNVTNVPHALFSGKRTAVYLHVQLERETAAKELAALPEGNATTTKRSVDEEARSVWDVMNGRADDLLYAGEFDQ
ncbi:pyridine nucleotide-disulfide oxidoreductase-like protein [Purpureocillium lavendulum]|uniref:Pyridine nucleotide-disulfide oxidoreductase-like protein n=1 Tax=Purpureocillium lavendulum TaxID=1247861 RepID=A0AB34FVM1_9HYPO|nr:pyridine nucleotide-disulfide oxidoreductase-like protein [Purpureocillium lavendulum]